MTLPGEHKFQDLKATGNLPSPQGVALKLLELADRDDVTTAELARALKADPALTGRVLKAANCAAQGGRPVAFVDEAVVRLGFRSVRQLALAFSLIDRHQTGACPAFDYAGFWSHALATAVAAQLLAAYGRTVPADECFTLGLLHNVGALALATVHAQDYAALLANPPRAGEAAQRVRERARFGLCHRELTALLLRDWGLPPIFSEAILRRGEDDDEALASRSLETAKLLDCAVHLGAICASERTRDPSAIRELKRLSADAGCSSEVLDTLLADAANEWREWGKLLKIPTQDVPGFEALNRQAQAAETETVTPLRVLIAEDEKSQQLVLTRQVRNLGFAVTTAENGEEALALMARELPDILLTDWVMPKLDGIDVCRTVRASAAGKMIYIIMMTAHGDENRLVEAFDAGADDYLNKPVNPRELQARLRAATRFVELQAALSREAERMHAVNTELAVANRKLFDSAHTDALTGLPNRRYVIERLKQEWSLHLRRDSALSVILLDIDHFKKVNDQRGHDVGDFVLERVARLMRHEVRNEDTVARFGGEEFLVVTTGIDLEGAMLTAERIREAIAREIFSFGGGSWHVTASLGVAAANTRTESIEDLLKQADVALYQAKGTGRNRVCS